MWNQQVYYLPGAPATLQGGNGSLIHSTEKNSSKNQPTAKLIKAQRSLLKSQESMPRSFSIILIENRKKNGMIWATKTKSLSAKNDFRNFQYYTNFCMWVFHPRQCNSAKTLIKQHMQPSVYSSLQKKLSRCFVLHCNHLEANTQWHQRTEPTGPSVTSQRAVAEREEGIGIWISVL